MGSIAAGMFSVQLIKMQQDWENYLQLAHAIDVPQERARQIFREEEALTMSSLTRRPADTYRCAKQRLIDEGK